MSVNYARPYPEVCKNCDGVSVGPNHWKWNPDKKARFGGSWKCRELVRAAGRRYMKKLRADPVRSVKDKERTKQYCLDHAHWLRYKAYRHVDNKRFGGGTIPWKQAEPLMDESCTYCGTAPSNGLDRRNNQLGHSVDNVVPCCFICNTILGDIPAEVKDLLAPGLREAQEKGLLDKWTPPQARR